MPPVYAASPGGREKRGLLFCGALLQRPGMFIQRLLDTFSLVQGLTLILEQGGGGSLRHRRLVRLLFLATGGKEQAQ